MATERNSQIERLSAVEARMSGFENAMRELASEVHALGKAIVKKHDFDPAAVISTIKDIATLAVVVTGGIIWIATSISDKPVAVLDSHISQLEKRIDFLQQRSNWEFKKNAIVSEHAKGLQ